VFAFNMDLLDPKWRGGQTGCVPCGNHRNHDDGWAPDAHVSDWVSADEPL